MFAGAFAGARSVTSRVRSMRFKFVITVAALAASSVIPFAAQQRAAQSRDVSRLLAEIKRKDKGQLAISEEDGRFLRLMIASSGAKRALEIGGASGYSAIWMGQGLRATGGRLVTIEYDPVRAKELTDNVQRAGLSDIVQVVAGDAFEQIPKIPGTFDFVFLDAWKKDYKRFFDTVYPRLDARGLFIAHSAPHQQPRRARTQLQRHRERFHRVFIQLSLDPPTLDRLRHPRKAMLRGAIDRVKRRESGSGFRDHFDRLDPSAATSVGPKRSRRTMKIGVATNTEE